MIKVIKVYPELIKVIKVESFKFAAMAVMIKVRRENVNGGGGLVHCPTPKSINPLGQKQFAPNPTTPK